MAFFRNNTVNLLNLHYGAHAIAMTGGGAFFAVYLLKSGVSAATVFAALAGILLGRFALRPLVIPIGARAGLRLLLIGGTLLSALQYPVLAEVAGIGAPLLLLVAMSAIGDTVYWSAYHAYFAALGDNEHRGHQIGAREAIAALVGIISPLIAGWLLVTLGPRAAFGATGLIVALSAAPLLWTPDVRAPRRAPGAFRPALVGFLLFAADGWMAAGWIFAWQIALFVTLGESYLAFGGAMALAALVGAGAGLALGRGIDNGHGQRMAWTAIGAVGFVIALRAAAIGHPALAVGAHALGAIAACLIIPAQMTPVYTLAKTAPCTLRFHVVCEGGWDLGGACGLLVCAALTALGAPLWAPVALALLGAAAILALLQRYYGAAATTAPA